VVAGVQHLDARKPSFSRRSASIPDFSIEVVPTSTGWPRFWQSRSVGDDRLVLLGGGAVDLVVLVDAG
jgi:hypothetical protein